ncbi:MAG: hypothetical protein R6V56_05955, partial [Lentisphaeria bacterium]
MRLYMLFITSHKLSRQQNTATRQKPAGNDYTWVSSLVNKKLEFSQNPSFTARPQFLAVRGWADVTEKKASDLAREMECYG